MAQKLQPTTRCFSFADNLNTDWPAPWRVAFPGSKPLGYYRAFERRCLKLTNGTVGVVDEETARKIWISILKEYEDFQRMGMWLPEEELEDHKKVAIALGWY